jgi:hypothetical protein
MPVDIKTLEDLSRRFPVGARVKRRSGQTGTVVEARPGWRAVGSAYEGMLRTPYIRVQQSDGIEQGIRPETLTVLSIPSIPGRDSLDEMFARRAAARVAGGDDWAKDYETGFSDGVAAQNPVIEALDAEIKRMRKQVSDMSARIRAKGDAEAQVRDLLDQLDLKDKQIKQLRDDRQNVKAQAYQDGHKAGVADARDQVAQILRGL